MLLRITHVVCDGLAIHGIIKTKSSSYMSRLFPIELLDVFQSCFKEYHWYFAGLYLLYRFIPLVIFANIRRLLLFHAMLSVQFLIMLTLYSAINPYKSKYHNRNDSFILANISLVNILTTYNFTTTPTFSLCNLCKQMQTNAKDT